MNRLKGKYDVDFSPTAKLPFYDKLIYSINAGFSANVSWVCFGYYLLYFYTDVFGISATVAGTIVLFSRLFDAVTDIVMGWAVDRFNLRWGKYRSWSILAIVPMFVLLVAVFTAIPTESMALKIAWASVTYGSFGAIACTLVYIPTSAQLINITKNVQERASVAAIKTVFSNVAVIVVASFFMPLVNAFGGSSGQLDKGFFWASCTLGAIVFVIMALANAAMKKYELNEDGTSREHLRSTEHESILRQVKGIFTNRPAVVIILGIFFQFALQAVKNGTVMYMFEYCFLIPNFVSVANLANTIAMVAGVFLMRPLIKFVKDTNRAFIITMLSNAAVHLLFFALIRAWGMEKSAESIQYGLLFFVYVLSGLLTGAHFGFSNILIPNTVDYGEWKNHKSQPGLVYALVGICLTVGGAVGSQILGAMLDGAGYVPNVAQSVSTQNSIVLIAFLIPAAMMIVQAVIQLFFGLSDKKYAQCVTEVRARIKDSGAPEAEAEV